MKTSVRTANNLVKLCIFHIWT